MFRITSHLKRTIQRPFSTWIKINDKTINKNAIVSIDLVEDRNICVTNKWNVKIKLMSMNESCLYGYINTSESVNDEIIWKYNTFPEAKEMYEHVSNKLTKYDCVDIIQ
jgi:hypothetical protein